jgi:hypothetical protein
MLKAIAAHLTRRLEWHEPHRASVIHMPAHIHQQRGELGLCIEEAALYGGAHALDNCRMCVVAPCAESLANAVHPEDTHLPHDVVDGCFTEPGTEGDELSGRSISSRFSRAHVHKTRCRHCEVLRLHCCPGNNLNTSLMLATELYCG